MSGPERIQDWLLESSMAFSAASDYPFGHTTLHDLTMADEDEDFMLTSGDESNEEGEDLPPYVAQASALLGASHISSTAATSRRTRNTIPMEAESMHVKKLATPMDTEQPFLYSGRLMLVALPGLALVVSIAGDLLITVLTIGAIVIYMLQIGEVTNRSLIVYICTFGCCQLIVIYSALPLIWHTLLNIFLIGLLNCFAIFTGAWGLLFFEAFRKSEPHLTRVIETCLFGVYPAINVILLTWIIGSGISPAIAPYGLLAIGFMVLQLFMTPTPSSFNKPGVKDADILYVLDSATVGAMALVYTVLPSVVYTYLTIVRTRAPLFSIYFMVELLFLGCLSAFLATWMNLREFLDIAGVEYRYLQRCRWGCGLGALLLLSAVLHKYGFSSSVLPWLTLGIVVHAIYGFVSRRKQYWVQSAIAALMLSCLYGFIFSKLPWKLDMWLEGSGLHINMVQGLLYANTFLCVACIYASTNWRPALLSWLVILQTLGLVAAEKLLWSGRHYLTHLLVLSAVIAIYFIMRLLHANKLSWQPACLCIAIHLTKLNNCCDVTRDHVPESGMVMLYEDVSTLLLGLFLTWILFFEKETMSLKKWLCCIITCLAVVIFAMPAFLTKAFIFTFGGEPTFAELTAVGLMLAAVVSIKLSLQGDTTSGWFGGWFGLNQVGPTVVVASVVLFHLNPEPVFTLEEINKWLVLVNMVSCFFLVPFASLTKSVPTLCIIGVFLGMPLGIALASWMLPSKITAAVLCGSGAVTSSLVCLALFVWRKVPSLQSKLLILLVVIVTGCVALLILDDVTSYSLLAATGSAVIIAFILKLHSHRENHVDLIAGIHPVNHIAVVGNLMSVISYVLLGLCCPISVWEIWFMMTSTALLLLQRDHLCMKHLSHHNNAAPMIIVTTVVLWVSTCVNSSTFLPTATTVETLTGLVEMLLLCVIIPPLYIIYFTMLWQNQFYISDRLVVFVTPANLFLFIFGSTYHAWAFALYGVGVGTWLITYKLPLIPNAR